MEAPEATDGGEGWVSGFELEVVDQADRAGGPVRVLRWP
jgi:hypothetical protein